MDIMNFSIKEKFIIDTSNKLPKYYSEWCINKSEVEIKEFVKKVTDFAHQHFIFESHNIFDLIHYEIGYSAIELLQRELVLREEFEDLSKDEFEKVDAIELFLIMNS